MAQTAGDGARLVAHVDGGRFVDSSSLDTAPPQPPRSHDDAAPSAAAAPPPTTTALDRGAAFITKRAPTGTMLGLLITLLSTFAFSAMALFVSIMGPTIPATQQVSTRQFTMLVCTLALIAATRRREGLHKVETWLGKPENRWPMVRRGLWGICGMGGYFLALTYPGVRVSDAAALVFLNVPLTAIFARLLLKEAYSVADAVTAVLCMAGVVLVAQPPSLFGTLLTGTGSGTGEQLQPIPWQAVLICLFSATTSAMAYISIRQIGKRENTLVVVLYFAIVGSIAGPLVGILVMGQVWALPASSGQWAMLLGMGFLGWIGQLLLNKGVAMAPAGPATIMRYTDVVFTIILQVVVIGVSPNWVKLVGCALIMSAIGAFYVKFRRKQREERAAAAAAAAMAAAAAASTSAASSSSDEGGASCSVGGDSSASGGGAASKSWVAAAAASSSSVSRGSAGDGDDAGDPTLPPVMPWDEHAAARYDYFYSNSNSNSSGTATAASTAVGGGRSWRLTNQHDDRLRLQPLPV